MIGLLIHLETQWMGCAHLLIVEDDIDEALQTALSGDWMNVGQNKTQARICGIRKVEGNPYTLTNDNLALACALCAADERRAVGLRKTQRQDYTPAAGFML